MYQTILVPLDGSKRAEAILPHVEELAWRYNAKIILLQVVDQVITSSNFEFVDLKLYEQELNRQKKEAAHYLATVQKKIAGQGCGSQKPHSIRAGGTGNPGYGGSRKRGLDCHGQPWKGQPGTGILRQCGSWSPAPRRSSAADHPGEGGKIKPGTAGR